MNDSCGLEAVPAAGEVILKKVLVDRRIACALNVVDAVAGSRAWALALGGTVMS